jgi:hypothetical protein
MPISRMQQPRQMYGLGSFVKKAVKGVTGAIKKIAGSGLGKAALLGLGGAGLMGMGPLSALGGLGASSGTGIASILSKGKSLLGGLTTGQRLAGSLGLAALASAPQEVQEESSRDIGALRKYLASYYENLGYSADEIAENVARDTAEYTSGAGGYAEGGRIGYREGALAMGPAGSGFTLKPPGELAYDATNTDIYGSSAASFTPKTIMNASGDQVQAGFGKTPGPNTQIRPADLPFMGRPVIPDIYNRPATLPSQPLLAANPNGTGAINTMPPGIGNLGTPVDPGARPRPEAEPSMQQIQGPIDTNSILQNYGNSDFFSRIGTMDVRPFTFGGKEMSGSSTYIGGLRNYLDSIGKGNLLQLSEENFKSQQLAPNYGDSPLASTVRTNMLSGGRIGYNEGTPEMGMIDPNKAKQAKQMIGMGADQDLISTITGLTKEQVEFLMREDKAYGGRMGFAMGNPEENAIQASGIMNLPLNKNPAGITELDLRETGGFIPPVGVKEKADDIPAMLSNNEFVFTADAVRGMGDGNVNKGAQRMYDMMKKLEKGGRV